MMHPVKPITSTNCLSKTSEEPVNENPTIAEDDEEVAIPETELIPEGPTEFAINEIELLKGIETPYGVRDKVRFTFRLTRPDENGEMREGSIRRSFNLSCSAKSDLVKFLAEIRMPNPGKTFRRKDYLGIIGRAEVKHVALENGDEIAVLQNFSRPSV